MGKDACRQCFAEDRRGRAETVEMLFQPYHSRLGGIDRIGSSISEYDFCLRAIFENDFF